MYVDFTDPAKADLREIVAYGHQHFGRTTAKAFYEAVLHEVGRLLDFPEMGRVYSGMLLGDTPYEIRVFNLGRYQVFYEVTETCVRVHAIIPKGKPRES